MSQNISDWSNDSDESLGLEGKLSDICAALVTDGKSFLVRLFSSEAGVWLDTASLCADDKPLFEDIQKINEEARTNIVVTWLD